MRLANNREPFADGRETAPDDLEHVFLRETARALADAHQLLERPRSSASRLESLKTQAVSDQDKLVTAQSRRIQSLELQLDELQAYGANQSAALNEAIALVTELEERMSSLERTNAELHLRLTAAQAAHDGHGRRDERTLDADLDLIRTLGTSDDLKRFNDFVRSIAA